ncbi:MAG: tRNA-intron lyase [Candidatus Aenigmatarchaeota archaeon]|nr:tRNA-intron lyase [Candidatus Aenigmarchaeota archaeon]
MTIEKIWEGELIEERVIIWDKDSITLYDESGYGKPLPEEEPNRLELDLVEAAYLVEKGKLRVIVKEEGKSKKLTFEELMKIGSERVNEFHPQYIVFRDLRERGYLVKTGYKFGAHFRLYERGVKLKRGPKAPHEHTKAVVHAVAEESAFSLPELSRAVRLAHNIRATMWWAVVDRENDVTYYEISRLTP